MSTPYTTKAAIQNYLQKDIGSALDTQLTAYIAAMSEYADQVAGYPIYRDSGTTRLYDGINAREISIDPVHTITEIQLDDVVVTPYKVPYNSDIKRELKFELDHFTKGTANLSVTGTHALSVTLSERLAWAVTVLVAGILNQVENQLEGVKSEKIGDYSVTYADGQQRADYQLAQNILKAYKPITF